MPSAAQSWIKTLSTTAQQHNSSRGITRHLETTCEFLFPIIDIVYFDEISVLGVTFPRLSEAVKTRRRALRRRRLAFRRPAPTDADDTFWRHFRNVP